MNNVCLCVLGMHRSGTSALTGALDAAGVQLGNSLMRPSAKQNAKGFWEHWVIVGLHDALLASFGFTWDDVRPLPDGWWKDPRVTPFRDEIVKVVKNDFGDAPLWGLKDPRICRLLPLWLEIFDEVGCDPRFAIIFRHPMEVAQSLQKRRESFGHVKGGFLWLEHNLSAERWSRGRPRIFTSFDALVAAPTDTVRHILKATHCPDAGGAIAGDDVSQAVASGLRHHAAGGESPGNGFGSLAPMIDDCYRALQDGEVEDSAGLQSRFDELRETFEARTAAFDEVAASHIADLQAQVWRFEQSANPIWKMRNSLLQRLHDHRMTRKSRAMTRRSA